MCGDDVRREMKSMFFSFFVLSDSINASLPVLYRVFLDLVKLQVDDRVFITLPVSVSVSVAHSLQFTKNVFIVIIILVRLSPLDDDKNIYISRDVTFFIFLFFNHLWLNLRLILFLTRENY